MNQESVGRLAHSMEAPSMSEAGIVASGLELSFSASLDDSENLEQLGPVIKNITETGKQAAFLEGLDELIRKKDGEIERMCNAHYQVKKKKKGDNTSVYSSSCFKKK
jgi:hypothetical protein